MRFASAMALVAMMALGVYGGATLLFPSLLPATAGLGATSNVPASINHQGVVAINGVRFTGSGQFKFAIVDRDTGNSLWTNDGTQLGGTNPPDAAVTIAVTDGIYNIALGNTGLANMTGINASIFSNGNTALRIWFNDGVNGFHQLAPDHQLRTAPYAFHAETVTPGSIGTAGLADGAVTSAKLASQIGVWTQSGNDVTYTAGKVGIGGAPTTPLTVNGTVSATAFAGDGSQLTGIVPSGTILPFGGTTAPGGYLLCNGEAVSRTTYSALFAAIGTSFGQGDGSTTFNVPDFRGMFLRGRNAGSGVDPDAASRTALKTGGNTGDAVGSRQWDEVRAHTHGFKVWYNASGYTYNGVALLQAGAFSIASLLFGDNNVGVQYSGGNESRPVNVAVNYIIKF